MDVTAQDEKTPRDEIPIKTDLLMESVAGHHEVRRHFLFLFVPLVVLVGVVATVVDFALINANLNQLQVEDLALVRSSIGEMVSEIRPALKHLKSLPTENAVRAALDAPTPETLAGMANNFITLLQRNPTYDQARWIDATGMERVRVDKGKDGDSTPVVVSGDKLQNKSDRPYFRESIQMKAGDLYVSELDFNIENGKVEIPYKPTLRVVTPVADRRGDGQGIFIINILMKPSLENFIRRTDGEVMLLNRRSELMYGPDNSGHWGYGFDPSMALQTRFPSSWARIVASSSGQFIDDDGLWSWDLGSLEDFNLPGQTAMPEPYWLAVYHRPSAMIRELYFDIWGPTLLITIPLLLLLAIMSWAIALRSKQQRDAMARTATAQAVAEEQKRRVSEMKRAQEYIATLAAIVESSDDAIVSKTLDSVITSWNPGAEKLFGYGANEIVGQPMTILFPPGGEGQEQQIIARIAAGETVRHFEGVRRHKDGHLIDVSVTISPIRDADGHIIGASKVARDITERKREMEELERYRKQLEVLVSERTTQIREANQRLEDALAEAELASRAKSQFLANMSHEIRTPMNAVLGFLSLVLETELPETSRRQLTTAHNSAKSLLLLLNDILDISKMQSGKLDVERVLFNLPQVLRLSIEMMQLKANEKKIDLRFLYQDNLPCHYIGDPMRIRQIVTNLVGNAIKFTDEGHVVVSVVSGGSPGLVELSVSDTGIGMTAEQVGRIFTPFVQADSSTTRRFGGTGLGVSICKQLAEHMGGRIWVDSKPGLGSTFHVSLRLDHPECADDCPEGRGIEDAQILSLRLFKILLVDDIEENVELAETRLSGQGHEVIVARNGREAVQAADAHAFDVILMDVHMPEMNGLEATAEIRRRQKDKDDPVPIIALTASVLLTEQQQCFNAGMNAFIGKPIDFNHLFRLMESVVPAGRGRSAVGAEAVASEASRLPALEGIDLADGMRRWGDLGRYTAALASFSVKYADVGDRLRQLDACGDWAGAHELSHALKGVAGNLAVFQVARIAAMLSDAYKNHQGDGIEALLLTLAEAWTVVIASIDTLQKSVGDVVSVSSGEAPSAATLEELRAALATDDPGAVETVLDRLSVLLSPENAVRLRDLISEFEFDAARALVDSWAMPAANAGRTRG